MREIFEFLLEIFRFVRERKKLILLPLIILFILLVLINFIGSSSAVAPFIYTLF